MDLDHRDKILAYYSEDDKSEWYAVVTVGFGDRLEPILVRGPSDLLTLRLQLAPLASNLALTELGAIKEVAQKAFCAWHEHESHYHCWHCDPHTAHREEIRARRQAEEAKQAQAAQAPEAKASIDDGDNTP